MFLFAKYVTYPQFKFKFTKNSYHYRLLLPLRNWIRAKYYYNKYLFNEILILGPRGGTKSSLDDINFVTDYITLFPNDNVLILSKKEELALAIGDEIRSIITTDPIDTPGNEKKSLSNYKVFFGDNKGMLWTRSKFSVKSRNTTAKEPSVTCAGLETAITSGHYDLIIIDDPTDIFNTNTVSQRDKLSNILGLVIEGVKKPNTLTVYITTRYDVDDLAGRKLKRGILTNSPKCWQALYTDPDNGEEKSYWEEVWTVEKLREKRDTVGIALFEAQYNNNPVFLQGQIFKREDLLIWEILPPGISYALFIDPAISENKGDYTSILIIGYLKGEYYVKGGIRGQWNLKQIGDNIAAISSQERIKTVVIESVSGFKAVTEYVRNSNPKLSVIEFYPERISKEKRALLIAPLFENRKVFLPYNDEYLISQLIEFPGGKHDDTVDTLVMGIEYLRKNILRRDSLLDYKKSNKNEDPLNLDFNNL